MSRNELINDYLGAINVAHSYDAGATESVEKDGIPAAWSFPTHNSDVKEQIPIITQQPKNRDLSNWTEDVFGILEIELLKGKVRYVTHIIQERVVRQKLKLVL